MLDKMSDDIPPLIPETPPPMTKLDWEDDEEFMDFPHLALEIPSESSLSENSQSSVVDTLSPSVIKVSRLSTGPESGWNPIDDLPYDRDIVDPPIVCSKSNVNHDSSCITKDDEFPKSVPEQELNLHKNDLSIWKDKENIVPWENINKLKSNHSCDSVNELDCKSEINHNVSSENVIDNNRKTVYNDMHTNNLEFIIKETKCLPNLELQSNDIESIENNDIVQSETNFNVGKSNQETLINSHLECIDTTELSNQANCVQNVLLDNLKPHVNDNVAKLNSSSGMFDLSINNNNNIVIKNDQEEYSDFCDFETPTPNSLNVSLPNRTSLEQNELIDSPPLVDQQCTLDNKLLDTRFDDELGKLQENTNTQDEVKLKDINLTFQSLKDNNINPEHNLDTEFDDFCDFHAFQNSETETKPIHITSDSTKDNDFCDFKTSIPSFNNETEFKHSNTEKILMETNNDNDTDNNLTFKSDNQYCLNNDDDDDNFCDFESGYSTSSLPASNQVLGVKQNNVISSESKVQINYQQFCKDAFQGDYELCDEVDLQNLENELNTSQIWQNLKDVESSPALSYNWSKSESNNVFLSSLSIDSRNILYGASWNSKVPRFAANMSNNPLEPLKASNNDTTDTKISQSFSDGPLQETVPDPEFDWKSSGLINPLDCNHTSLLDLEFLDTLAPCCTNALQPQTWKTSEIVKEEESPVLSSPESLDVFDKLFGVSLPPLSSDHQLEENIESPSAADASVSLEAQRILDNLPDFEVLQKPYLVILEKGNNNLFLN